MKIYLAARYSRRLELCGYREQLEAIGHDVTARWLNGSHQISDSGVPIGDSGEALVEGDDGNNSTEAADLRKCFAMEDLGDVHACDLFIAFTEPPRSTASRGGRHVEFGYALGLAALRVSGSPQIIVVGHRENLFHWLDGIDFYETWDELLKTLRQPSPESLADEFGLSRHLARAACRGKEPSKWRHAVEQEAMSVEQDFDEDDSNGLS